MAPTAPLSHDEFFVKLAELFSVRTDQDHGSIHLSQKRYIPPNAQPQPEDAPLQPAALLIRASNGKSKDHRAKGEKIKISTIVEPDQLDGFYTRYAEVCRGGMAGLKPRDRKKASAKKKKKKGGAAPAAAA